MQAVIHTEYGSPDVLHIQEITKPTPQDNEILIRIHATPVTFGDVLARNFKALTPKTFTMPGPLLFLSRLEFGFNTPKKQILGSEFAGEVAATGKDVTRFKVGDAVFGYRGSKFGANAEYLSVPENSLVAHKPANLTFEEAATVPYGGIMALGLMKRRNIQPGQKVLINGASGSIGAAAVQVAKHHYGAEVTGVCGTPRVDYVKALGADHVIDYKKEDFTQNGEQYDLILDVPGKLYYPTVKNSLTPDGILQHVSFKMPQLMQGIQHKNVMCTLASETVENLQLIKELVEAGKIKAFIDRCYPMEQIADAHRYFESGQKTGPIVINIATS